MNGLIKCLKQLQQERIRCVEATDATRHKVNIMERRLQEISFHLAEATSIKDEKKALKAALMGKVDAQQKIYDQSKVTESKAQVNVSVCMKNVEYLDGDRSFFKKDHNAKMMELCDRMSSFSLVCTQTRLKKCIVGKDDELQEMTQSLNASNDLEATGDPSSSPLCNVGWAELVKAAGDAVGICAGAREDADRRLKEVEESIVLMMERRNSILMSNK